MYHDGVSTGKVKVSSSMLTRLEGGLVEGGGGATLSTADVSSSCAMESSSSFVCAALMVLRIGRYHMLY